MLITQISAQHQHAPGRTCFAHDKLEQELQQDPARRQQMEQLERATQAYLQTHGNARNGQTRVIPVHIHVLWRTSQENISDAQIQSQIDVLNADFGGTNPDLSQVPSEFQSVTSQGTGISFTVASINRKQTSRTSWGTNDAMKFSSQGGLDAITPSTHMNMWICNIGGGILGYAQFPGGNAATDGVVFSPQYCGTSDVSNNFYLSAPFDKGRTAVHEVGHYLNLRHIWGDGGCNADDFVGDTPIAGASNNGCPSYPSVSCSTNDMFMNYMDYVNDACMFMFSQGQEARMWACLTNDRPNLGSAGSGGGGGTPPPTGCNDVEVTLTLNFDQYASETSWALTNASGTTVASGSGYGSANNNNGITETFCLPAGCYDFTINDSYGDGICCQYGNGSYDLSTGGSSLISGSSFGSTETQNFCVGGNGGGGTPPPPACTNVVLDLNFDRYASETSWSLVDGSGTAVASGSGYGSSNNNSSIQETFCLPAGCYDFIINDSYSDGICCRYGNGSYSLTAGGSTLASGGSFGSSETKRICVGGASRVDENSINETLANPEMHIYPNPAKEVLNVELLEMNNTVGRIVDATGRTLWTGELEAGINTINLSQLPAGMYFFTTVQKDGKLMTKRFVKQ